MKNLRMTLAPTLGLLAATAAMADQTTAPQPDLLTTILTDAIRIEVDATQSDHCAPTVAWAFNLPRANLVFDPQCVIVTPDTTLTQNLNN